MIRKVRAHLSYANVVATLGLFIAIATGTAYAANTVFSTDIVDGQVKTVDLDNGAVTVAKIADGGITGDKIKDSSIQSRDVLDNNLKGADIDESTLSNIGGGGPAGGDLAGTYPNPTIKANALGGAEIIDNSITGLDVDEATLVDVARGKTVYDHAATSGITGTSVTDHFEIVYTCGLDGNSGSLKFTNMSNDDMLLFVDTGATNPFAAGIGDEDFRVFATNGAGSGGDHIVFSFYDDRNRWGIVTVDTIAGATDCRYVAQGLLSPSG